MVFELWTQCLFSQIFSLMTSLENCRNLQPPIIYPVPGVQIVERGRIMKRTKAKERAGKNEGRLERPVSPVLPRFTRLFPSFRSLYFSRFSPALQSERLEHATNCPTRMNRIYLVILVCVTCSY